jgi:hypothetical protein
MDEAGQASTDYTDYLPSDALKESIMSKFNFAVYPAIAVLSLAAAFSAHAQSANDPVDQAGYGAMVVKSVSLRTRAEVRAETIAARKAGFDANFREGGDAGYGVASNSQAAEGTQVLAGVKTKAAQ